MVDFYPIIPLPDDAPELPEQQGTKTKYWLYLDNRRHLFKIGRANTGENWAEKVACELCKLLGLPHAHYEFAEWKGIKGVVSETIVPPDGRLVMGNELLAEIYRAYPKQQNYKVQDHTLGRIVALLSKPDILLPRAWQPPGDGIGNAVDVFLGYLLLDAWIANQDRHHENWGVIHNGDIYLSPTYDHAASMGQNERDNKRQDILTTKDRQRDMSRYIEKARSAIYLKKSEPKPLLTVQAFAQLASARPAAAAVWLQRLNAITPEQCQGIFAKIPSSEISPIASEFAMLLLERNKTRLLKAIP